MPENQIELLEQTDHSIRLEPGELFIYMESESQPNARGFKINPSTQTMGCEEVARTLSRSNPSCIKVIGDRSAQNHFKEATAEFSLSISKTVMIQGSTEILFSPSAKRVRILTESIQKQKAQVLIIDDSKTIRELLKKLISESSEFEVCGMAETPSKALEIIQASTPDLITLDLHLPEMNGVELLKKIHRTRKIPTLIVSALSMQESTLVLDALEAGAIDYFQKPTFDQLHSLHEVFFEKLCSARDSKSRTQRSASFTRQRISANLASGTSSKSYIAIGSSTGGTEALRELFATFPEHIPPTFVVQHIPPVFSKALADRLNSLCPFTVEEAKDGTWAEQDHVYIAPGGQQMEVVAIAGRLQIRVTDAPPMNRHKPSVDHLFHTLTKIKGYQVSATILTGMGADGAKGLKALRDLGAHTIAQDEASCVVFGMPKEAIKAGGAIEILPLSEIGAGLFQGLAAPKRRKTA